MPIPEKPQPSLNRHIKAAGDAAQRWFEAERAGAEYQAQAIAESWQWDVFFQFSPARLMLASSATTS